MPSKISMKPNSCDYYLEPRFSSLRFNRYLILIQRIIGQELIVIQNKRQPKSNIGSTLQLIEYAFYNLNLHQLYANIGTENASTALSLALI
jgi:hypothetical protein